MEVRGLQPRVFTAGQAFSAEAYSARDPEQSRPELIRQRQFRRVSRRQAARRTEGHPMLELRRKRRRSNFERAAPA